MSSPSRWRVLRRVLSAFFLFLGIVFASSTTEAGEVQLASGLDTSGVWFPDPRGPKLYAGGALWLGLNFGI